MAEYDRDLVATIADAVSAYVHDAQPEDVALEVLTNFEAEGWRLSHPNDLDGGSHQPASDAPTSVNSDRPPARAWKLPNQAHGQED